MCLNNIFIIGGGASIKPELETLKKVLKDKLVIGINYSFKFIDSTFTAFVDDKFYLEQLEELKELPLILGKKKPTIIKKKLPNTYLFKTINKYNRSLKNGVYKSSLSGIFSTSLAIYLIETGNIYLLGFDFGAIDEKKKVNKRLETHFYQDKLIHRGTGKNSYYKSKRKGHRDFGCFRDLKGINIYNVSPNSNLEEFPKISYNDFYKMINNKKYNQDKLRNEIIKKVRGDKLCI